MLEKALKRKKKPGKKRKMDDDMISDEELAQDLEGWLEAGSSCILELLIDPLTRHLVREMYYLLTLGRSAFCLSNPALRRHRVAWAVIRRRTF